MAARLIFFLTAVLVYLLPVHDWENGKFYLLSVLLLAYNVFELRKAYLDKRSFFFISPIFLSVLVMFGLVFGGIANFLLLSEGMYAIKGFGVKVFSEREWLTKTMFIVCIAAVATWLGYATRIGERVFQWFRSIPMYDQILKAEVSTVRIFIVAVIAYLVKFYLLAIGLYGRIVSEEYFSGVTGFKEGSQIRVLSDLSYVTFFFISILKFQRPSVRVNIVFFASLAFELFFGFIYGARSAFITPFLILFIAYYYVRKRIGLINLTLVAFAVYLAFTLVLDYKNYVLSRDFSLSSNSVELISNFNERQNKFVDNQSNRYKVASAFDETLISVTFVPETAVAIRQKDLGQIDEQSHPNIIYTLLKFPVDAFVPRFIQGENEFSWGYWFKDEIIEINRGLKYSIAMSPVGFLYIGGGIALVSIGFFFYGTLLKFGYQFLLQPGLLSMLIYLMVLSALYNLDSIYSNALIYITRYVLIFPILFWFIFDPQFMKFWKNR